MTDRPTSPSTTATVTKITAAPARKRSPSAATRKANATKATAPKVTKAAAPKVTKPKIAKVKVPSSRDGYKIVGTGAIKALASYAMTCKVPAGLTRDDVVAQVGKWASYLPGDFDGRLVASAAGGRREVS